jgi:hypothetical protein
MSLKRSWSRGSGFQKIQDGEGWDGSFVSTGFRWTTAGGVLLSAGQDERIEVVNFAPAVLPTIQTAKKNVSRSAVFDLKLLPQPLDSLIERRVRLAIEDVIVLVGNGHPRVPKV